MPIDRVRQLRLRRAILGTCGALTLSVTCLAVAGSGPVEAPQSLRLAFAQASTGLAQRFEGDGIEAAARVTLGPRGEDLRVAGDLMDGMSARVATLLAAHPEVRRIHLTSGGGLVEEGMALGALVAERGLATYVPDECASACTLVFVRGSRRYLGTGGRLGFHAPYEAGLFGQTFAVDAAPERAAYRAAGIAADFTTEALAVSSDDIWVPDADRLIRAGVVTEVVETDRFPDSTLDDDDSLPAARAQVLRNLPILATVDPAVPDALAAWYRDGYAEGRSEADALDGLQRRAAAHLRQVFGRADDATIRALGHAALKAMREVEATDRSACEAIGGGDVVVMEESLRHARHPVPSVTALVARARRHDGTRDIADGDHATPDGRRAGRRVAGRCGARIETVRRALDRPAREAAILLRRQFLDEVQPEIAEVAVP